MDRTDALVILAKKVAAALPRDPKLHRLGYDRAVEEVEAVFAAVKGFANKVDSVQALVLRLLSWPEQTEWDAHALVRELGLHIKVLAQGILPWWLWYQGEQGEEEPGPPPVPPDLALGLADIRELIGFAHWAYVGSMPFWKFQSYPFRGGWKRMAAARYFYREIPMEERGAWVPDIPQGWRLADMILHHREWIYVIEEVEEGASLPPEWEPIDFSEGEVVAIWDAE